MWGRALAAVEAGVARGLIAAGYCAYELGYVFERRLQHLMPATGRPLLRFHLFRAAPNARARARGAMAEERAQGPAPSAARCRRRSTRRAIARRSSACAN